jgi:opacity protein-like surface antigen
MKSTITRISTTLVPLVLIAAATSANAQSAVPQTKLYGELGYTALQYKEPAGKADLGLGTATIGYEINKNFAVEGMLGTGITDDNVNVSGTNVNVDVDNSYGVFLKPKAQIAQDLEVFAKVGWAKTKLKGSAGGFSASNSGSDLAYGAGAQYNLTPTVYIAGGYMKLYDKDSVTADGWNVGVGYKF